MALIGYAIIADNNENDNDMEFKSITEERLIIQAVLNKKQHYFLIDTGATVGLISDKIKGIKKGRKFNGSVVGVGGQMGSMYISDTFVTVGDKQLSQFLITNIDGIIDSIKKETGIEISGIISLPQLKLYGAEIDTDDGFVMI